MYNFKEATSLLWIRLCGRIYWGSNPTEDDIGYNFPLFCLYPPRDGLWCTQLSKYRSVLKEFKTSAVQCSEGF